jgi:predicted Zn finger-like uncharacterized protein
MMLTRCPGCSTTFRVTPEQVKARQGKVRCGRCQHVFDAIESLVEAAVVPPAVATAAMAPASAPVVAAPPPPEPAVETVDEAAANAADPIEEDDASPSPAGPLGPTAETPMPVREDELDAATQPPESPDMQTAADILLQPSPLSSNYAETPPVRQASWPWTLGATLVFIALIAQALIAFRVDLAVKYPQTRPLLDLLCEYAACAVELPAEPDMVSIESSDLHPGKKGGLELNATLRNRAPHAQAWPHLELTLTDGADKPIVRKVIAPEQYLPASQSVSDGFAANGDLAVQLMLDAGTLPAAGYRLYLFYP